MSAGATPSRPDDSVEPPDGPRISREKRTIAAMVQLYCHDHHGTSGDLCSECETLQGYAFRRLDNCPFEETKPACNRCEVHCYSKSMRERVREVMRYSGPRMLLRHPVLAIRHLLDERKPAPKLGKH